MRSEGEGAAAVAVAETVMTVDSDVVARMAISAYLRECGYRVIEASSADEAMAVLADDGARPDVVLAAAQLSGDTDGFALAQWVRRHRPGVEVVLAGSTTHKAEAASQLCEEGPHLAKPYEPQVLADRIRQLLARRPR